MVENCSILFLMSKYQQHLQYDTLGVTLSKWNVARAVGIFGGMATCLKWTFLTILPFVVYYNEVFMSPRKDEIVFSDHFTKLDYEREIQLEKEFKLSKKKK